MAEKRVELEVNGKIIRVVESMVADVLKFGATYTKRIIKEPPVEIMMPLPKKIIIPRSEKLKEIEKIAEKPVLKTEPVKGEVETPVIKEEEKPEPIIKPTVVKKTVAKRKPVKKGKR